MLTHLSTYLIWANVSLFGIADTSDAHLAVLVSQSAAQLSELQSLLKTSNMTSKQLNDAVELADKMQRGIDQVLKPLEKSKQFQDAIMNIKDARNLKELRYGAVEVRDYFDTYKSFFPEKAEEENQRREDYENFEKEVSQANRADLDEIKSLENEILRDSASGRFSPARAQQVSAQIQLKQWESQILLREQIQRLMDENNTLREEIARERRKKEIQEEMDSKLIESRWRDGWKEGL